MEKIFVQIASYRDEQCQWTIRDMYAKAAHPERIFTGICWQFDEIEDKACFIEPYPYPAQVRTLNFHPRESMGSGWAHAQAQSLYAGEDYVLQIHAHMRFEQDWDEMLITMLARCPSEKPVLATCLPGYTPNPDKLHFRDESRASFTTVYELKPDEPELISLRGALVDKNETMNGPSHTPFWVGNFLFTRAETIKIVPFDPHILYYGETLAYSARLFTHGYDLFEPDQLVLYHWWGREFGLPRPYREFGSERQKHSFMRVRHLLRIKAADESAALVDIELYGLGTERPIDYFWHFAGTDFRTGQLTERARAGRWNDAYAHLVEYNTQARPLPPRIFVQIASYRDPECQWTVKDLFEKAKYSDRVFVGICWQHDPEEDQDFFRVSTRPEQVRTALFHWKESQGVCWARHQTQLLWQGEEYTLMIDSHMRFEFDWDERMIDDLALCGSPKALMSNYPASFTPPHNLEAHAKPTVQRAHPYEGDDIRFRGDNLDRLPPKPLSGAFIAAGLLFARSEIISEIPYDPYLYFNQEELSLAARFYTHGWEVHSMRQVLVYHLYITDPATKKRSLHWEDNKEWIETQQRARRRMDHLMGFAVSDDPLVTRDIEKYGMGTVRTLEQFSEYCGVDFKNRIVTERALRCGFIPDLLKYKNEPIYIPEVDGERKTTPAPVVAHSTFGLLSFPDPEQSAQLPWDEMQLADNTRRKLHCLQDTPKGMLVIPGYLEKSLCDTLARYAAGNNSIEGMAGGILSLFNDAVCHRAAPYYNVDLDWYERPQVITYFLGGGHDHKCDAEQWNAKEKKWERTQDRDISILITLNDGFDGGEIHFPDHRYSIKPTTGMLIVFPSDHRFLYTTSSVTSGTRYALASWAAAAGGPRVTPYMPGTSVYLGQKRKKPS